MFEPATRRYFGCLLVAALALASALIYLEERGGGAAAASAGRDPCAERPLIAQPESCTPGPPAELHGEPCEGPFTSSEEFRFPQLMRAVVSNGAAPLHNYSGVELIADRKRPRPARGEVVVEMKASSVNPVDWKLLGHQEGRGRTFPYTLGFDAAGIVTQCVGCTRLKVGDEVWGDLFGRMGAWAEYALGDEELFGLKPRGMPFLEAGTLPLVGLTSLQALKMSGAQDADGRMRPWPTPPAGRNFTVVVTAGVGGTGFVALQIARALGATDVVAVVGGEEHAAFARSMGATRTLDHRLGPVWSQLRDESVDVVYDNYGAPGTADAAMPCLRAGGTFLVILGGGGTISDRPKAGVRQVDFGLTKANGHRDLDELAELVEQGKLRAHLSAVYPLGSIPEALEASAGGHLMGKVGITTEPPARFSPAEYRAVRLAARRKRERGRALPPLLRHVVMWKFKPEATDARRAAMVASLRALKGQIPQVLDLQVGTDYGWADGNHHVVLTADFASVDEFRRYTTHPAHILAKSRIPSLVVDGSRAAAEYAINQHLLESEEYDYVGGV